MPFFGKRTKEFFRQKRKELLNNMRQKIDEKNDAIDKEALKEQQKQNEKENKSFLTSGIDHKVHLIRGAIYIELLIEFIIQAMSKYEIDLAPKKDRFLEKMEEIKITTRKGETLPVLVLSPKVVLNEKIDFTFINKFIEEKLFYPLEKGKKIINKDKNMDVIKEFINDSKSSKVPFLLEKQRHAARQKTIKSFQEADEAFEDFFGAKENGLFDIAQILSKEIQELKKYIDGILEDEIDYETITKNGLKLKTNEQGDFCCDAIKDFSIGKSAVDLISDVIKMLISRMLTRISMHKENIQKRNDSFLEKIEVSCDCFLNANNKKNENQDAAMIKKIFEMYVAEKCNYPSSFTELEKFIQSNKELSDTLKYDYKKNIEDSFQLNQLVTSFWFIAEAAIVQIKKEQLKSINAASFYSFLSHAMGEEGPENFNESYAFLKTFLKYSLDATDENGEVILYSNEKEVATKLNDYVSYLSVEGDEKFKPKIDAIIKKATRIFLKARELCLEDMSANGLSNHLQQNLNVPAIPLAPTSSEVHPNGYSTLDKLVNEYKPQGQNLLNSNMASIKDNLAVSHFGGNTSSKKPTPDPSSHEVLSAQDLEKTLSN